GQDMDGQRALSLRARSRGWTADRSPDRSAASADQRGQQPTEGRRPQPIGTPQHWGRLLSGRDQPVQRQTSGPAILDAAIASPNRASVSSRSSPTTAPYTSA